MVECGATTKKQLALFTLLVDIANTPLTSSIQQIRYIHVIQLVSDFFTKQEQKQGETTSPKQRYMLCQLCCRLNMRTLVDYVSKDSKHF